MTEKLQQGSPEWRVARCGSLGASEISDALAKDRSGRGWGKTSTQVMARLIAERLTGIPTESYQSQAMREGTEKEPDARAAYQFRKLMLVRQVGLIKHPKIIGTHASPDSEIGDDGLLEIKCPMHAQHLDTLLGGSIKTEYVTQMQWQLACTGRQWVDFLSYHPAFPENMQLHITRVQRDDRLIADLEAGVKQFLHDLHMKLVELTGKYGAPVREAA